VGEDLHTLLAGWFLDTGCVLEQVFQVHRLPPDAHKIGRASGHRSPVDAEGVGGVRPRFASRRRSSWVGLGGGRLGVVEAIT
ncbi:hypothetical protein, partial [Amycolatopsis sp.]|uniref:hypothetical protein n=1 Tax=Amycolatopsis sp. TaxID=37632 RepID=UPI002D7EB086